MSRFSSPQVRPFLCEVTEPESPLHVTATHGDQGFEYQFSLPEWSFLGPIILLAPELTSTTDTHQAEFWRQVLDYGPQDELDFVETQAWEQPLPEEIFSLWPCNTQYEFERWERSQQVWESWLRLGTELLSELPSPNPWVSDPPKENELRQLEFELAHALPSRLALMKRLHGFGLLVPDDHGKRASRLLQLGCHRLAAWRKASVIHHWVSPFVDGMKQESILASPVGLDWFYHPPAQQRYLDPLHHLKFAVHQHIKGSPPQVSSAFVVSMGGRISGAFFYELGPGGVPQLVRGGEPQPGTELFELYQHNLSPAGDRFCELAARSIRAGWSRWGGILALSSLQQDPGHGQSWVELGVALFHLKEKSQAKACLEKAQFLGHSFSKSGELAAIWELENSVHHDLSQLEESLGCWQDDLKRVTLEEATAAALSQEVLAHEHLREALKELSLPAELFT